MDDRKALSWFHAGFWRMGAAVRVGVLVATILFAAQPACPVDPAIHITQYSHMAWRIRDGFFPGAPTAIAQTTDGYLWIGTANGLFRFDGVRFVPWTGLAKQKQLASAEVSALLGARDGSLWIGAGYRFLRWKDNTLSQYSTERDEFVSSIVETSKGAIWLTRERYSDQDGPLCHVQDRGLHCYGHRDGVPLPSATSLVEDAVGNLWAGSTSQLLRWQSTSSTVWTLKALRQFEGLNGVKALAADRDNSLWVGISHPGPGLGLEQFRDGVWKTFLAPQLNGSRLTVSKLFLDRDGAIWVGTEDQGIYRITGGNVDHFDSSDGLSGDSIADLFQDHEGTVWVATSKGVDSFRDLPVVTLSRREGLHLDGARSVLSSRDGTIWIGNVGALDAWRNGAITSVLHKDGLPGRDVTSLLEDTAGRLWVGIDNGLFLLERQKFVPVIKPGAPSIVTTMTSGPDGGIWAQTSSSTTATLFHLQNGHLLERRTLAPQESALALASDPQGRIWLAGDKLSYLRDSAVTPVSEFGPQYGYIRNIAVDGDDFVWFGATEGLVGFREGKLQAMTTSNGLPCERINTLIFDNQRSLWLYAQCGLIKIEHSEMENWWRHPDVRIKTTMFDVLDGFQGGPSSFRPAAAKSSDGRLWFANGSIVQSIDPEHTYVNGLPPPVHIEQVIADTKNYSPENTIRFPKLSRTIEIRYTALSLVVPQRVRFRYRLDGYDNDWQEAGTRRSAFYTNLRPGMYKFLVTACNNSGVWNNQGAELRFMILPAWYQTMWFRLLALLVLALLSYGFYLLRMRQYAATMRARFNERLDERTQIARNLHDTLLQTIQGSKLVADQARSDLSDPAKTESHLSRLSGWLDRASLEGRAALESLRMANSGSGDLTDSIRRGIEELQTKCDLAISLSVKGAPSKIHPVVGQEIFMIGYEAIGNACRHSGGRTINVQLSYESGLTLRVRDDGHGLDEQTLKDGKRGHFGLAGMRERAQRINATLNIVSDPAKGTEIQLMVPGKMIFDLSRRSPGFSFKG